MDAQPASRRSPRLAWAVILLSVVVVAAVAVVLITTFIGGGSSDTPGQIALRDARTQLVWNRGPFLKGTYPTTMADLQRTLDRYLPAHVAQDVDVAELRKTYGPTRRIDVVALTGVFNTLPPDEGVTAPGTVVALVDPLRKHVILVTD